jgi:hypothetical protein
MGGGGGGGVKPTGHTFAVYQLLSVRSKGHWNGVEKFEKLTFQVMFV